MTQDAPPNGLALTLNSPIAGDRLDGVVADLAAGAPRTVADIGCGWAEILIRILESAPDATGVGIDNEPIDVERGRELAQKRGVADRITLIDGDGGSLDGVYDLVLCVGASHALDEEPASALRKLRSLTIDGGRLLFGIEYWLRTPSPERLDAMWGGISLDEVSSLAGIVATAAGAGWRLLDLKETTQQEWNDYECGLVRNQEEWLLANSSHPQAESLRTRLDAQRSDWLGGHHGYLGFAWLTLAALPAAGSEPIE